MSNSQAASLALAAFLAPVAFLLATQGDQLFVEDIQRGELYYFMSPS